MSRSQAERWRRIEELFHEARARPAGERTVFLHSACGSDAELLSEVELLLAQGASGSFLERPAVWPPEARVDLSGRQIGAYRVDSLLGAGGMGEVYRARDTKLGREVAIKVLPATVTTDGERLSRFEREARVLATLNHPNIGAIYGFEDAGGVPALVLELVEGPTLAEKLAQYPAGLPLSEALALARQIAEALDAAHEKGIVHRDLKPANIKITPDGVVKVLDFGLAKLVQASSAGLDASGSSQAPTITVDGTRDGLILGTAAYMSPEQARGLPVDKRSDIWSFGAVLYEMLTGKTAFSGGTVSDLIAGILERAPDWAAVPAVTPSGVRRVLQRCLEKDVKRRLRDIAEAQIEIEDAIGARSTPEPVRGSTTNLRLAATWVLIGTIAIAAAAAATWFLRPGSTVTPAPPVRLALSMGAGNQLALEGVAQDVLAISPDGKAVAYVVARANAFALYMRLLSSHDAKLVAEGRSSIFHPFFSPDSKWLAFSFNGKLRKISIGGGQPVSITDAANFRGGSWSEDGSILFAPVSRAGLMRVPSEGGTPEVVTTIDAGRGETSHRLPWILPGGKAFLYVVERTAAKSEDSIWVAAPGSAPPRLLIEGATLPQYVSTGHLLYVQGHTLMAVSFDPVQLQLTGAPVPVVDGVGRFAASQTGSLIYGPDADATSLRTLVWVDRRGQETPLAIAPGAYSAPRLSPDGRSILLAEQDPQQQRSVLTIYEIARDVLRPLTVEDNRTRGWAIWSADGLRITYSSILSGSSTSYDIFSRPADGTGVEEALVQRPLSQRPYSWSSDGRLAFTEEDATGVSTWILSTKDGSVHRFSRMSSHEGTPAFSPDGRWVAYGSPDSGQFKVFVRPASGQPGQWQISNDEGVSPIWSPTGREMFFRSREKIFAVDVAFEPTFTVGKPHVLFEGPYLSEGGLLDYDVTRDGQRFLMVKPVPKPNHEAEVTVVQNWFDELRRLAPSK